VLESVSRLTRDICTPEEVAHAAAAREHLAVYRKNEDLVSIGAYQKGANPQIDRAITLHEPLRQFLRQGVNEFSSRSASYAKIKSIVVP